jgi:hypothetical protein
MTLNHHEFSMQRASLFQSFENGDNIGWRSAHRIDGINDARELHIGGKQEGSGGGRINRDLAVLRLLTGLSLNHLVLVDHCRSAALDFLIFFDANSESAV